MIRDEDIAQTIRRLVQERGGGKTICPSEAARALSADWRPLMPRIRAVSALLPEIVAMQQGVCVDPVTARGPIRLKAR